MVADSFILAMNAIQQLDQLHGFDCQAGLFPHLAHHGGQERLTQFDEPARQRPMALQRLGSPPHHPPPPPPTAGGGAAPPRRPTRPGAPKAPSAGRFPPPPPPPRFFSPPPPPPRP